MLSLNVGTGIRDVSSEDFEAQNNTSTSQEATQAAWELAKQDTAVGAISRMWQMHKAASVPAQKITADEANAKYPMDTPFREDVSPIVAQKQFQAFTDRRTLEEKVARGPQDAYNKLKRFGVGMAAHLIDPVELGTSTLIGWGVGGIIAKSAIGAALAEQAGSSIAARTALSAGESITGNFLENVGTEALNIKADMKEKRQYDPIEGLTNLTVGTFLGAIPHVALKEFKFRLKGETGFEGYLKSADQGEVSIDNLAARRNKMILDTSPEADRAIVSTTVGNLSEDVRPDVAPILQSLAKEIDVETPGYEFKPAADTADFEGKKIFLATREATDNLAQGTNVPLGDDYGIGIHATDNPGVANAAAARTMSDAPGNIHEAELTGEVKPLSLEGPVPDSLKDQVRQGLTHIGEDANMVESLPMKTVLKLFKESELDGIMPEGSMQAFGEEIKNAGYNALVSDGSEHMGVPMENRHNHITLLDESLVKQKSSQAADPSFVRKPTDAELNALRDKALGHRESMLVSKANMESELARLEDIRKAEGIKKGSLADSQEFEKAMNDLNETFDSMEKQGLMDEGLQKEREALNEAKQNVEAMHTMRKAFMDCMGA
jgi:hypothetical protein